VGPNEAAGRLAGKRLILGVSGGIAAYKACDLASRLVKEQAAVTVVLTRVARRFVTPYSFQALTGRPCITGMFHRIAWDQSAFPHLDPVREADLVVIAPATANLMARLAAGLAGDVLTALCLSARCPVLVCPAMNVRMWEHPATQRNARTLAGFGYRLFGPASGPLACGDTGVGRMLEPPEIVEEICRVFAAPPAAARESAAHAGPGAKGRVRRHGPARKRKAGPGGPNAPAGK
jgi:phosphopantothenoylcysteine decarboxylase/phosphopantothenate--cysteine ligase